MVAVAGSIQGHPHRPLQRRPTNHAGSPGHQLERARFTLSDIKSNGRHTECLDVQRYRFLYEGGFKKMLHFVSETAKYGDFVSGPRVINDETRERMKEVLADIQSGAFARQWIAESEAGKPEYQRMWDEDLAQPVEQVGAELRKHMAWLQSETPAERPTPTQPQSQAA